VSQPVNVLVVADGARGTVTGATRELLAAACALASARGGSVDLLVLGTSASPLLGDAAAAGADRVFTADAATRAGYHPDTFAAVVDAACAASHPRAVLLSHGALGLDLAPRVAFRQGWRWATNCTAVSTEAGALVCQRSEVGGKVQVVEAIEGCAVLTLRPKSVEVPAPQTGRDVAVVALPAAVSAVSSGVEFVERQSVAGGAAEELEQASLVVTGGLGMGSPEAFDQLGLLARALGASLGGSKQGRRSRLGAAGPASGADGGPPSRRGCTWPVAVSGALQHMAGCQKSKLIVAINNDASAPIFRFARYGVVGTWEEVVPELITRLEGAAV
jgi:electron transfer flavoprotein alpha subunit